MIRIYRCPKCGYESRDSGDGLGGLSLTVRGSSNKLKRIKSVENLCPVCIFNWLAERFPTMEEVGEVQEAVG